MAKQPSREVDSHELSGVRPSSGKLRDELTRQGLPHEYIERLLAELDDHYTDLLEERSSFVGAARKLEYNSVSNEAEQRLGEPVQLAVFAAEHYHNRSFWGRHPWLTFGLLPLPMFVASLVFFAIALVTVGASCAYVLEHLFHVSAPEPQDHFVLQTVMMVLISWYIVVLPPIVVALLLCRVYRRNSIDQRWPILGCGLVAVATSLFSITYRIATAPHDGMMMMGFSFSGSIQWVFLSLLPKFIVAFGIGLLLVKRAQQQALASA